MGAVLSTSIKGLSITKHSARVIEDPREIFMPSKNSLAEPTKLQSRVVCLHAATELAGQISVGVVVAGGGGGGGGGRHPGGLG